MTGPTATLLRPRGRLHHHRQRGRRQALRDEHPLLAPAPGLRHPAAGRLGVAGRGGPGAELPRPGSGGPENDFTNRNTTFLTWNLMHLARMLRDAGRHPGARQPALGVGRGLPLRLPEPGLPLRVETPGLAGDPAQQAQARAVAVAPVLDGHGVGALVQEEEADDLGRARVDEVERADPRRSPARSSSTTRRGVSRRASGSPPRGRSPEQSSRVREAMRPPKVEVARAARMVRRP